MRIALAETAMRGVPLLALGRGWLLWSQYMPSVWPSAGQFFEQVTGLSLETYFLCFAGLLSGYVDVRVEHARKELGASGLFDTGTAWAHARHMEADFRKFLELEALGIEQLARELRRVDIERVGPSIFRAYPIARTSDGRAIVIDPASLAERASVGPLLLIKSRCEESVARQASRKFGEAVEHYVRELISTRYPNGTGLVRRAFFNVKLERRRGTAGEIDAAVVTGAKEICIFEVKASFISDPFLSSIDSYVAELQRRYGQFEGAGEAKPRGAAQLAGVIRELAAGGLRGLPPEISKAETIIPVLVTFDHDLDAPGHAEFLRSEFVKALAPDSEGPGSFFSKRSIRVAAPVLATLDDFEWLDASLENFGLGDFLKHYASTSPDRTLSLREYALASDYRRHLRNPEAAAQATIDIFDRLARKAFGRSLADANN